MTSTGIASHTNRSKLVAEDPIPVDILAARHEIERQDRAFVDQLRAAIQRPLHGPRSRFADPCGRGRTRRRSSRDVGLAARLIMGLQSIAKTQRWAESLRVHQAQWLPGSSIDGDVGRMVRRPHRSRSGGAHP